MRFDVDDYCQNACKCLAACCIRSKLLQALAAAGVEFIVAPYEADAQMAYLAKRGLVDFVITEDSDLLVYGCPQVVFKLARSGECDHIKIEDLPMNRSPSFAGFSHDNFIEV